MSVQAGDHYVTYKAATAYFAAAVVTAFGMGWNIKGEVNDVGEKVATVAQDVAVVKVKIDALTNAAIVPSRDIEQAQYVLVQLPPGSAAMREQSIERLAREIITKGK